jgi:hypothetical protein
MRLILNDHETWKEVVLIVEDDNDRKELELSFKDIYSRGFFKVRIFDKYKFDEIKPGRWYQAVNDYGSVYISTSKGEYKIVRVEKTDYQEIISTTCLKEGCIAPSSDIRKYMYARMDDTDSLGCEISFKFRVLK